MDYIKGHFGVLNTKDIEEQPLILLDGGIEARSFEHYSYDNSSRYEYGGYLFQYTLSGYGWFEKKGKKSRMYQGMAFFANIPEDSRYYLEEDSPQPWEFLYLHFDGYTAEAFMNKLERLCQSVSYLDKHSPPVTQALKFYNNMLKGRLLDPYEGGEFLYLFLCAALREIEHPSTKVKNPLIHLALQIMKEEYANLEGVEPVSIQLGISQEHFTRSFKACQGITPIHYLTNLKIQAAVNELLDTEDKIETIALRNGFSSGNYFAKVFRKYMGISPGEYRSRVWDR